MPNSHMISSNIHSENKRERETRKKTNFMGNYRFRLSDMIPNAWFYKLRDMSNTKNKPKKTPTATTTASNHHKKPPYGPYYHPSTTTPPPHNHQRNSIYYTPKLPSQHSHYHHNNNNHHHHEPPRKSSRKPTPNRKTIYKPSPKHTQLTESTHNLQDFFHSPTTNLSPSSESTRSGLTSCTCRLSSSTSDIIIDVNDTKNLSFSPEKDLKLPPIITKPAKPVKPTSKNPLSGKKIKENNQTPARKSVSGVKLRSNSPKLSLGKRVVQKSAVKKMKKMPESFAIVKSSFDPHKDFMESMMEMILENNIKKSKDLEQLLACYLSLNSDEYHDVIVKAFEEIWFSLPDL